uniref:Homeobox domain-containing protein n=1 Tax=Anopheles epiroticus TaxID=199890 RepID=A0A182PVH4_9DIPT
MRDGLDASVEVSNLNNNISSSSHGNSNSHNHSSNNSGSGSDSNHRSPQYPFHGGSNGYGSIANGHGAAAGAGAGLGLSPMSLRPQAASGGTGLHRDLDIAGRLRLVTSPSPTSSCSSATKHELEPIATQPPPPVDPLLLSKIHQASWLAMAMHNMHNMAMWDPNVLRLLDQFQQQQQQQHQQTPSSSSSSSSSTAGGSEAHDQMDQMDVQQQQQQQTPAPPGATSQAMGEDEEDERRPESARRPASSIDVVALHESRQPNPSNGSERMEVDEEEEEEQAVGPAEEEDVVAGDGEEGEQEDAGSCVEEKVEVVMGSSSSPIGNGDVSPHPVKGERPEELPEGGQSVPLRPKQEPLDEPTPEVDQTTPLADDQLTSSIVKNEPGEQEVPAQPELPTDGTDDHVRFSPPSTAPSLSPPAVSALHCVYCGEDFATEPEMLQHARMFCKRSLLLNPYACAVPPQLGRGEGGGGSSSNNSSCSEDDTDYDMVALKGDCGGAYGLHGALAGAGQGALGGAPAGGVGSGGGGKVRVRTSISEEQQNELKRYYARNSKPSRDEFQAIAHHVKMEARVVQVWFQNNRSRERKMGQTVAPIGAPNSPLHADRAPSVVTESATADQPLDLSLKKELLTVGEALLSAATNSQAAATALAAGTLPAVLLQADTMSALNEAINLSIKASCSPTAYFYHDIHPIHGVTAGPQPPHAMLGLHGGTGLPRDTPSPGAPAHPSQQPSPHAPYGQYPAMHGLQHHPHLAAGMDQLFRKFSPKLTATAAATGGRVGRSSLSPGARDTLLPDEAAGAKYYGAFAGDKKHLLQSMLNVPKRIGGAGTAGYGLGGTANGAAGPGGKDAGALSHPAPDAEG